MSGYLELADGGFIGVRDGLVLGRVSACDVVVNDTKASRRHARLIVAGGVVEIEDMDSSNGTLLNGKPVDRRMMRDGDEVRIGKTVIVYREGALPGAKSSSRTPGSSATVFDDDDDLFGDSPGSASPIGDEPRSSSPAPRPASPKPAPPSASDDLLGDELSGGNPPPPPKSAPSHVVEFEDEVVEVQQAPVRREPDPGRHPAEPVIEVRKPQPAAPPLASARPSAGGDDVVGTSGRVLQYSKKASGKSPLGDDLGQMSGGMRLLVAVVVLAIGVGIVYGIMTVMK